MGTIGTTNFTSSSKFGKGLDKELSQYEKDLQATSDKVSSIGTIAGEDQSTIIKKATQPLKDKIQGYTNSINDIEDRYNANTAQRRKESEQLVQNIKHASGIEANIAAAKAGQGGRMSVSQLTSIGTDITNKFAVSLNNAQKDNIQFQADLDAKMAEFGLSIVDKRKILDEFNKSLTQEESAPLLDAIASNATNKQDFIKKLGETVSTIHTENVKATSGSRARDTRVSAENEAFNLMSSTERQNYLADKFPVAWATLSRSQQQSWINKAANGEVSLAEINNFMKNMKDKNNQANIIQQQAVASDRTNAQSEAALQATRINSFGNDETYTKGTTPGVPGLQNGETMNTSTYRVGNITYTSKADYDRLNALAPKLAALKESNPALYKDTMTKIKNKYVISN